MKVMIDTNIFISAALFPNGRAAEALLKALILESPVKDPRIISVASFLEL